MECFRPDSTQPRVVIVEDDETLAMLICYNVLAEGMNVSCHRDGREAVTEICANPPDAIVLDWNLPTLSGIEVLRLIRRHPTTCDVPVLMLTARSDPSDRARAVALGVDRFLTKPFSVSDLMHHLGQLLCGNKTLIDRP